MGQSQSNPSQGGRTGRGTEPGAHYRDLARKEGDLRRELSQKSQDAYRANNGALAKSYSVSSQKHQKAMETYNALAASEIFASKNPHYLKTPTSSSFWSYFFSSPPDPKALSKIDLHGLYVQEALPLVKEHLALCRKHGVKRTCIITGRGLHSPDGVAKIRPQVEKMLIEERLKVVKETGRAVNEGAFMVEFMKEGEEGGWGEWLWKGLFGA